MSFFSKLFTRSITYIEALTRDAQYQDILHVFGAVRVMPDEGDSYDIYRHSIIDLNSYEVTNGLQQRGNEFSLKSAFAKRCIEHMSQVLNRKLVPVVKKEEDDSDEEEIEVAEEFENLEDNCELPVTDVDSSDTDTGEAKKLPRTGLVFMKNSIGNRERFLVQLYKSGIAMEQHQMSGVADYFRFVLYLKSTNRIVVTYRKESWIGTGGMAFFVLDASTGSLLHNAEIK